MSKGQLDRLSALSTLGTGIAATVALMVAVLQIVKTNEGQREATAQDAYKEYLTLAIQHPDLANGYETLPWDQTELSRYEWFVSYFLHSAEHVFLADPSKEWRAAISSQVCYHQTLLRTEEYAGILESHYTAEFCELVALALSNCDALDAVR